LNKISQHSCSANQQPQSYNQIIKKIILSLFIANCSLVSVYSQSGWYNQYNTTDMPIMRIFFVNENTGWACSAGGYLFSTAGFFYRTSNGGSNWSQVLSTDVMYYSFIFINSQTGWLTGWLGDDVGHKARSILKSTNSGSNWTIQKVDSTYDYFLSIDFINSNHGYCAGSTGTIFQTTDSGLNWISQPSGTTSTIYKIKFISDLIGWFVTSSGGIYKTTNSGMNWFPQTSGVTVALKSIHFIDQNTGWCVGQSGKLIKTTNSGINWVVIPNSFNYSYNDIYFTNNDTGWIVSDTGHIIKSTDGGSVWLEQSSSTIYNLNAVFFLNSLTGWAGGGNNFFINETIFLKTINGGISKIDLITNEIPNHFKLYQNYPKIGRAHV
jgi:photosystem II stability/assembly factor-like uncharacterized protein